MASLKIIGVAATASSLAVASSPNGEAGVPVIRGVADPGATVTLNDTPPAGPQVTRRTTADANGNWVIDYGAVPYLTSGTHLFQFTTATASLSATFIVGSKSSDTISGPAVADFPNTVRPDSSTYVLAGEGSDRIVAYTGSRSALFFYSYGVYVSIDGQGGTDTVVIPTASSKVVSAVRSGGSLRLTTADATVTVANVEKLAFDDVTMTVRFDPLVDFFFYDRSNRDVVSSDSDPIGHFDDYGWREGRNPNGFFSTSGYLSAYRDVAAAGVNPLRQYDSFGWKEGRDPSARFDTNLYLLFNPDVKAAGIDPLAHWLQSGQAEGRKSAPAIGPAIASGFDATYYALSYADIGRSGVDPAAHFHVQGWKEGRDPNALFSTSSYLAQNTDVRTSGIDPLEHYMKFGWKEGRDPSPYFSTTKYLAAYKDVAAAGVNPLQHFLTAGLAEGRSGFGVLDISARSL